MDIWSPLQTEITALLRDYLRDDDQIAISGRNPIASINEVLRSTSRVRERVKVSVQFPRSALDRILILATIIGNVPVR